MRSLAVTATAFALLNSAGCGGSGYRNAVEVWAHGVNNNGGNIKMYVAYIARDCRGEVDDRALRLQPAAGLSCVLDEDSSASTPELKTPACACAYSAERCISWAQEVLGGSLPQCEDDTPAREGGSG
jgi:hypothetical protein